MTVLKHYTRIYGFFYAIILSTGTARAAAAAAGIDRIVIGGLKTKWTTRMTHYARTYACSAEGGGK